MDKLNVNECLLVSVDFTRGTNTGVLIVGRQKEGKVDVINAFQGQEAIDIYNKLITVKKQGDSVLLKRRRQNDCETI